MGFYTARDINIDFSGELQVNDRGDIPLLSSIDTQKNLVNFWLRTDFGEYKPETSVGCNIGSFIGSIHSREGLQNLEETVESTLKSQLFAPQDVIAHAVPFDVEEALVVVEFAGTYMNDSGKFEDITPEKVLYTFPYINGDATDMRYTGIPVSSGDFSPRNLRGTNYFPCCSYAIDDLRMLLPVQSESDPNWPGYVRTGTFSSGVCNAEIAEIAAAGLNNIRTHSSFYSWYANREGYMSGLKTLCRICNDHNISVTYIIWSTTSVANIADISSLIISQYSPALLYSTVNTLTDVDHAIKEPLVPPTEPGWMTLYEQPSSSYIANHSHFPEDWDSNLSFYISGYLNDLGTFFGTDPVGQRAFYSYDFFNEPEVHTGPSGTTNCANFIAATYRILKQAHTGARGTVGAAGAGGADIWEKALKPYGVPLQYHSFHIYPNQYYNLQSGIVAELTSRQSGSIPVVMSEFEGVLYNPGKLGQYIDILNNSEAMFGEKIGGQVWGYIESNLWQTVRGGRFDGIIRPSGTDTSAGVSGIPYFQIISQQNYEDIRRWR